MPIRFCEVIGCTEVAAWGRSVPPGSNKEPLLLCHAHFKERCRAHPDYVTEYELLTPAPPAQ